MFRFIEPKTSLVIALRCDPDRAISKLVDFVEPGITLFWFSRNHKPFEGYVQETSFRITRILHYGNGFRPVLEGSVRRDNDAALVFVKMRMFKAISVGYLSMFGLCVFLGCAYVLSALSKGDLAVPGIIIFVGLPIGLVFLAYTLFFIEAWIALSILKRIWKDLWLSVRTAADSSW